MIGYGLFCLWEGFVSWCGRRADWFFTYCPKEDEV